MTNVKMDTVWAKCSMKKEKKNILIDMANMHFKRQQNSNLEHLKRVDLSGFLQRILERGSARSFVILP